MKYLRVRQGFYPIMLGIYPEYICKRGDAVTLFLVHLDVLEAPEPDKISRKKCTPTVALLFAGSSVNNGPRSVRCCRTGRILLGGHPPRPLNFNRGSQRGWKTYLHGPMDVGKQIETATSGWGPGPARKKKEIRQSLRGGGSRCTKLPLW